MKQLLILSGKGGTGKTTVAGALIALSNAKAFADCDVDAPNLHLIQKKFAKANVSDYYGLPKAYIEPTLCIGCGTCFRSCRFEAVYQDGDKFKMNSYSCEGCGVCEVVCPSQAITMKKSPSGEIILNRDEEEKISFSTARLYMGSGNSGKLVTEVKKQLVASSNNGDIAIIDGSPGIGCPVIASISGVDFVLIVAEPSVSGISDMERIIKTAVQLQTKVAVCVNKYDIHEENTKQIEKYCDEKKIPFVGKIPFDKEIIKSTNQGISIVESDSLSVSSIKDIYEKIILLI